jgi:hypothetical protein
LEALARNYIPGPGTYTNIEGYSDTNNERLYHLSQFKNLMTRRFGTSQRPRVEHKHQTLVPGPGSYRAPSEFGYLDFLGSPRT